MRGPPCRSAGATRHPCPLLRNKSPTRWARWSKNQEKPGFVGESHQKTVGFAGKSTTGHHATSKSCGTCVHRNRRVVGPPPFHRPNPSCTIVLRSSAVS